MFPYCDTFYSCNICDGIYDSVVIRLRALFDQDNLIDAEVLRVLLHVLIITGIKSKAFYVKVFFITPVP